MERCAEAGKRIFFRQGSDLLQPPGPLRRGKNRLDLLEYLTGVAYDGKQGGHILTDLRGVDINVDNLRSGGEIGQGSRGAVAESGSHRKEHVRPAHRGVRRHPAVIAVEAEIVGVVVGEGRLSHEGRHHGDIAFFT